MKRESRRTESIEGNLIKVRRSQRMAIIIEPPHTRIDNFHGYIHIHFAPKGKKYKIKENRIEEIYEIIRQHLKKTTNYFQKNYLRN